MNPIRDWLSQPGGLAERLRHVREASGLSGKQLAEAAHWAPSKVSRLENGKQMPSNEDIVTWARICGADEATARDLMILFQGIVAARSTFRRRMAHGQTAVQADYNTLVAESAVIRHFETVYVPGLLQTPDYARRTLAEMVGLHGLDVNDVENSVKERMQRQQHLYDADKRFEFLLAEPVLRWLLLPPDAMRSQLDRLQTVIGLPNVRFGVVPMGTPLDTAPQNSFQIYDDLTLVETFLGETKHTDEETKHYAKAMDLLWTEAVEGDDARRLIAKATEALPNGFGG